MNTYVKSRGFSMKLKRFFVSSNAKNIRMRHFMCEKRKLYVLKKLLYLAEESSDIPWHKFLYRFNFCVAATKGLKANILLSLTELFGDAI